MSREGWRPRLARIALLFCGGFWGAFFSTLHVVWLGAALAAFALWLLLFEAVPTSTDGRSTE